MAEWLSDIVITIHPEGNMHDCTLYHSNLSSSCRGIQRRVMSYFLQFKLIPVDSSPHVWERILKNMLLERSTGLQKPLLFVVWKLWMLVTACWSVWWILRYFSGWVESCWWGRKSSGITELMRVHLRSFIKEINLMVAWGERSGVQQSPILPLGTMNTDKHWILLRYLNLKVVDPLTLHCHP